MKKILVPLLTSLCINLHAQIHVGPTQTYTTISQATAAGVNPGDTIYIHTGTYHSGEWIADTLYGNPSQWITIMPYQDDSVSLTGGWTFLNAKYVKLYGLNWDGTDPANIGHMLFFDYEYNCFGNLTNIIVDHCNFMNDNQASAVSYAMIKFTGTDTFQVVNCNFINSQNIADGISMNGGHHGIIKNCRFENLNCWASHCKGGAENITYEKNIVINCAGGGFVMGGDTGGPYYCPPGPTYEARYIHVYSNITVGGIFGFRLASCCNSDVINNTCYMMSNFAIRVLQESYSALYFQDNEVTNNIFASNDPYGCYVNASGSVDYSTFYFKNNLYWDYQSPILAPNFEWGGMTGLNVSGSVVGDPLFTDPSSYDFSLQTSSPAKGAGLTVSTPSTDYNSDPYNATTRSIGAIEYSGLIGVQEVENVNTISIYPNPAKDMININWSGKGSIRKVEIYNESAAKVLSINVYGFSANIPLNNLCSGLYHLVMTTDKGEIAHNNIIIQ